LVYDSILGGKIDLAHQMKVAPSDPIHERNCDDGHQDHDCSYTDGRVLSLGRVNAGTLEEIGRVVKDSNHSGQLEIIEKPLVNFNNKLLHAQMLWSSISISPTILHPTNTLNSVRQYDQRKSF